MHAVAVREDSPILQDLESVSRRLREGVFHSRFDAMSLTSVELDDNIIININISKQNNDNDDNDTDDNSHKRRDKDDDEDDEDNNEEDDKNCDRNSSEKEDVAVSIRTTLEETRRLQGLEGFSSELMAILTAASIREQGTVGYLNQQIAQLERFLGELNGGDREEEKEEEGRCGSNEYGEGVGPLSAQWKALPPATDEKKIISSTVPKENNLLFESSAATLQARRDIHHRLQRIHGEVCGLLKVKLFAFELIDGLIGQYTEKLIRLAVASDIEYARLRAQYVVQPHMTKLLQHKFLDTTQINSMIRDLELVSSTHYFRGFNDLASFRLRLDVRVVLCLLFVQSDCALFVQYFSEVSSSVNWMAMKKGIVIVLLLWAISECFNNERAGTDIWKDPTFSIFVCLGDLTLLLWMWGVSISVWRKAGIDYIELLSLKKTDLCAQCLGNFTSVSAEKAVFESVSDLAIAHLSAFILFNKTLRGSFSLSGEPAAAHAIPSLLLLFYAFRFFLPFASSRKVYLRMLWKVFAAPYYSVKFRDGYIGDLLTSLVRVSISLVFSVVYLLVEVYSWLSNDLEDAESVSMSPWWQRSYLYRFQLVPFLTILPLWLRLMQCLRRSLETGERWPHLFNAMKYSCAIMVFSFGVLHPELQRDGLWIACLVVATCYQFVWDVTMDWGLLRADKQGKVSMRRELSLGSAGFYKAVVAANFALRFAWAITYVPREIHQYSPVYTYLFNNFQTVMAAAEIVRRMVWGFLRLEWEHMERFGSAPSSLSKQRELVEEASVVERAKREGEEVDGGYSMDTGIEMERMDVEASSWGRPASSFAYQHVSAGVSDEDCPADVESCPESVQEQDLVDVTEWIPLDLYSLFPFFCFKDLQSTIKYPRRRFLARVVEASALTTLVVIVMSISALSKMHSAGYI